MHLHKLKVPSDNEPTPVLSFIESVPSSYSEVMQKSETHSLDLPGSSKQKVPVTQTKKGKKRTSIENRIDEE